jgi:hypothetical protein
MARHLIPRGERGRRVAVLGGAVGIALVGYVVVGTGDAPDREGGDRSPATSEPTVLGAVITAEELPDAPPASPVSIAAATDEPATEAPVTTRAPAPGGAPPPTAPPATAPPPTTASTQPPPTLVPPTVIENTTTTTAEPSTTTTEAPPDTVPEG